MAALDANVRFKGSARENPHEMRLLIHLMRVSFSRSGRSAAG